MANGRREEEEEGNKELRRDNLTDDNLNIYRDRGTNEDRGYLAIT